MAKYYIFDIYKNNQKIVHSQIRRKQKYTQ